VVRESFPNSCCGILSGGTLPRWEVLYLRDVDLLVLTSLRSLRGLRLRHLKRRLIVLLLGIVILVPMAQSAFATKAHGLTYYTNENAYPSYLHLLTPADQALVEKAQADIERYRKSNITITVVDENGRPLEGVEIKFNQTDHNFLFGFNDFDPFTLGAAQLMKQAGFNLFVATPYWSQVEAQPGEYKWGFLERQQVEELRNMGFKIKVHPVVYHDPVLSPSFLRELSPPSIENENLAFVAELLRRVPDAEIYELSNEANWEYMRAGLSIDQYVRLLDQAASMIRAVQPNATLVVNTSHTFGEEPRMEYRFPDISPYDWYRLLISENVDIDAVGAQYRPGYLSSEPNNLAQNSVPSLIQVTKTFDRFAALGKRVHISEFEVPSRQLPEMKRYDTLNWNETVQAAYVEGFYTLIFGKPAADSIAWWFISSAMPNFDDNNGPRPFERGTSSLTPKASYYTLKNLIMNHWSTRGAGYTDTDGTLKFSGFGGEYLLTVTHDGLTKRANIRVRDGVSMSHRINFDRAGILREQAAELSRLRGQAETILQELDRIGKWSETINERKATEIRRQLDVLIALNQDRQYERLIELGETLIDNPFQMRLSGLPSDFDGFAPTASDPRGDTAATALPGTDLTFLYAFADFSSLYIGIAVFGDHPNKNLTYTTEIEVHSPRFPHGQRFHAAISRNGAEGSCWEEPWREGGIYFQCPYALGEVLEIRVSLELLETPETMYLNGFFVWQERSRQVFDEYDGRPVEIQNLRSFVATSTLQIETTTTTILGSTTTYAQTSSLLSSTTHAQGFGESWLPYIAAICVVAVLGMAVYWRRSRRRESEK